MMPKTLHNLRSFSIPTVPADILNELNSIFGLIIALKYTPLAISCQTNSIEYLILTLYHVGMSIESDIKQKALELGFDAVGITTAEPVGGEQADFYRRWIEGGNAGEMGYLHRNIDKRFDPAKLLPGAKSVICVALNYRPVTNNRLEACSTLRIARFVQYEDYHPFIKERLFQLAEFIGNATVPVAPKYNCGRDARVPRFKACVDSAPLAERALAQRAGLGFIGKNHMLIHPELGCQILLGELITTLQLQPDEPLDNQSCGDCGKCIRPAQRERLHRTAHLTHESASAI